MVDQLEPKAVTADTTVSDAAPQVQQVRRIAGPVNLATISSGFEKGDFLVREEKGQRVYFDFFEEAFNYVANKGYSRMTDDEEKEWFAVMDKVHSSVKGGTRYNTGKLLMVFYKPVEVAGFDYGKQNIANGKFAPDNKEENSIV